MSAYEDQFCKVLNFLRVYESLIDCHLVDFLTEDLWEKCLPKDLKVYLEKRGPDVISEIKQFDKANLCHDSELYEFLKDAESLNLEHCQDTLTRHHFLNIVNKAKTQSLKPLQSEFMKVKKWHEVEVFTKTVAWLNQGQSCIVIDAGAGKGYSSLHLANYYNFPVLAIECSQINHKGAILHRDLVNKKSKQSTSLINYAVKQIDETTDFVQLAKDHYPDFYPEKKLVMTALHACGSLTDSVIKSFVNVSDMKCLCIVPCCYHLASQSLLSAYEFSKNSRMLAQQSTERVKIKDEALSPSLFYRAVLQVIFRSLGIQDIKTGRGAPLNSFLIYAKWALKKIHAAEVPTDDKLNDVYNEKKNLEWKFHVFQLLRIRLAPVVEAAIILDKLLFIKKSNVCTKLEVVQMFDPLLSPRNWAIIATK